MEIVIDNVKADKFFSNLRTGFEKNLFEILVGVGLVVFILLLFILFYTLQKRKAIRKENEEYAVMYARLKEKFKLTEEEERLLSELSSYSKTPRKKYLLLTDQASFNAAFSALKGHQGAVPRDPYDALKARLGFKQPRRAAAFASTRDLPRGTKGVLALSRDEKLPVMVLENGDKGLSLSLLGKQSASLSAGKKGKLFIQTQTGIAEFPVTTAAVSGNTLTADHGEKLSDIQRRRFFRKPVGFTMTILNPADKNLACEASLLDLSGGGLSFVNPGGRFSAGEEVLVDFKEGLKNRIEVPAKIIRLSRGGRVAHAEFWGLKDGERDLIISALHK